MEPGKFNSVNTVCSICLKSFNPAPGSMYKVMIKGHMKHQCSYTCWNLAGGNKGYGDVARQGRDIK